MRKIRTIIYFFLAVVLATGVFDPTSKGQAASSSTTGPVVISLEVNIVTKPPEWMCLDDSTPITFTYVLKSYADRGRLVTPYPTALIYLDTTVTNGTLSKSSFKVDALMGSGTYTTTFKATKEGLATIKFDSSQAITLTGHSATETTIEKCDHTLVIDADDFESGAAGGISSALYGQGGINVDEMGVVTGGGPYQYFLGVYFTPPQPAFTCDKWVQVSNDSTFVAMGTSPGHAIELQLQLKPFQSKDLVANCNDNEGKKLTYTLVKGKQIDPNPSLNLGTLNWGEGQGLIKFKFGKGEGAVWLIKRQGGKK